MEHPVTQTQDLRFMEDINIFFFLFFPPQKGYMAPEIVSKKDYFGPPVDVWACGIILYVMMAGCFPFRSPDEKTLYAKIQNGTFEIPDCISTGAK